MRKFLNSKWAVFICLLIVLIIGTYFRFTGIDWDDDFHLHPDERFLTMVETSLSSVRSLRDFFDTNASPLNPHNVADANGNSTFPFFVYGTLPIFIVRYAGELLNQTGYSQIHIVGRYLSGFFDIGTILLVFLLGREIFRSRWIGIIAAAFYAFAPLPIQISHFFIVDNFTTFFTTSAILISLKVYRYESSQDLIVSRKEDSNSLLLNWNGFHWYAMFALALGLATASKLNAVAVALMLPLSVLLTYRKKELDLSSVDMHIQMRNLILAGLLSFVVFRMFQPYAFEGPGFFNFQINPKWMNNIKELQALSSGLSNYPPSLQWTRRSILFPLKNMVLWGMGLGFGVVSFFSILVMVWLAVKGNLGKPALLLVWNVFYILWQAIRWNPTMRYFLLAYPTMAVSSAWLLVSGLDPFRKKKVLNKESLYTSIKIAVISLTIFASAGWGFAFASIYKQPMTRIAASDWIYRNVEGPISLDFGISHDAFLQPIANRKVLTLAPSEEFKFTFVLDAPFNASQIVLEHVVSTEGTNEQAIQIGVSEKKLGSEIYQINTPLPAASGSDQRGSPLTAELPEEFEFKAGTEYELRISAQQPGQTIRLMGNINLRSFRKGYFLDRNIFTISQPINPGEAFQTSFIPFEDALLVGIKFFRIRAEGFGVNAIPISIEITDGESGAVIASKSAQIEINNWLDQRGNQAIMKFDEPVELSHQKTYDVIIRNSNPDNRVFLYGSQSAKETDWDDTLPLFMYGMNPFDLYSGVYQSDLNFQMYWDDNADKLTRFIAILDQADYIILSSNRQWGSVTQAQEKYPLSMHLYQGLLECGGGDVQKCYIEAEPSSQIGKLGFELVKTFHVQPEIFGNRFNTQKAEEAFTVYDHPKVFVFRKTETFSYDQMVDYLSEIDLSKVLNIAPQELEKRPGLLELPTERWLAQKDGGTWSDMFNTQSPRNTNQFRAVVLWYLFIAMIGIVFYPITRIAFQGLGLKGWGLSRLFGMIMVGFIVWICGSVGIRTSRQLIIIAISCVALISLIFLLMDKKEILNEIRSNIRQIITIEMIFLGLFLVFLLIRIGNPDLWHPYKGGEKPMDFAYFNALIKSQTFPPYDPWYAGGYINYYYWGFLLAAVPTKLLGIVPSLAYNLILPTFFAMTGIGAFSIITNLANAKKKSWLFAGLIGVGFVLFIGNMGTIAMITRGLQHLGENNMSIVSLGLFSKLANFFVGIAAYFKDPGFNYYPGDWYWIPSRSIPGEPITEFPFFTFLYGDPHAHLFAYPITLLALNWALSTVRTRWNYQKTRGMWLSIFSGALIVGALRPTNTWDFPVYLVICCFAVFFSHHKFGLDSTDVFPYSHKGFKKVVISLVITATFAASAFFLFLSYSQWYGQAYTSLKLWEGDKTPIWAYLSHWVVFLFIICSWLVSEVIAWMKATPLSRIVEWKKQQGFLIGAAIVLCAAVGYLFYNGVAITLIAIPVILTALMLALRKEITDAVRLALLLVVMGLGLTLTVEVIVLSGDVGRMNTVFKFYLQAWTCLALAASFALFSIVQRAGENKKILGNWHKTWRIVLALLVMAGFLYPVTASTDKITDRISSDTPATLDGMDYMKYAQYPEDNIMMDLSQDYALIRWMQENIKGTPRIIEANVPEYRWGSRISIYTGLPGVVGWNWHQRQQRAINPGDWVFERVGDVSEFYSTTDMETATIILDKYQIEYVVVGQLERIVYHQSGIEKFSSWESLFETVYETENTVLYQVSKSYD